MADQRIRVRIEGDTSSLDRSLKKSESGLTRFAKGVRDRFVFTFGEVQRAVQSAFSLIEDSARLRGTERALRASLKAQGILWDDYIKTLQDVSASQISNANLIRSSSRAVALGIEASRIPELLEIARGASVRLGTDFTKAFDDIVTGIGRASPLILDNLGIVVSLEEVYKDAAAAAGKTTAELTQQEKSAALLKGVLDGSSASLKEYAKDQDAVAAAINRARAAAENFQQFLGDQYTKVLLRLSKAWAEFEILIADFSIAAANSAKALVELLRPFGLFTEELDKNTENLRKNIEALEEGQKTARENIKVYEEGLRALSEGTKAIRDNTEAVEDNRQAMIVGGEGYDEFGNRVEEATEEENKFLTIVRDATAGIRENTGALAANVEQQRILQQETRETTSELQQLAIALGVDPSDPNLALTQGGRRLRFTGGSRLVGGSGFTTSGGTFQFRNGRRVRVTADGRVESAGGVTF